MPGTLRDILPDAHRHLLPAIFDRPVIEEPLATCADCAMCPKGAGVPAGGVFFKPTLKCCTYHPTLPNFLVGAILKDEALVDGRRRIRERIATRVGVTPQWIAPPRKQRVLLEASRGSSFGRSKVLLCPWFDADGGGRCTVWRHRESVCTTFFCKHEAGARGDAFWMATKELLGHVEVMLARRAARAVCPDVTEPRIPRLKLTIEDLEDLPPNDDDYAGYWASWVGREVELYEACHTWVRALVPADLERFFAEDDLEGLEGRGAALLADVTRRYEEAVATHVAKRLVPNPAMRITKMASGGVAVTTYSIFDSQHLSPDLYQVVQQFNENETVAETRARLLKEHDLEIPDELLLSLQRHDILIPPERARPPI